MPGWLARIAIAAVSALFRERFRLAGPGLALLAEFCDVTPILVATVIVALHHEGLGFVLPLAVYPDAQVTLLRTAMHVAIFAVEGGVLLLLATSLQRIATTALAASERRAEEARRDGAAAIEALRRAPRRGRREQPRRRASRWRARSRKASVLSPPS